MAEVSMNTMDSVMMLPRQAEENRPPEVEEIPKEEDSGDDSSGSDRSVDDVDYIKFDSNSANNQDSLDPSLAGRRNRHGNRRHKGGSRHNKGKIFQPYPSKSRIQNALKRKSQELKEKENAASVIRQEGEQFITFPVAPFNSTQFLMDEHNIGSPNEQLKAHANHVANNLTPSRKEEIRSPALSNSKDDSHLCVNSKRDKEFSDIYSTVHAESLQSMNKDELIQHYMSLEEKVADLERKVAKAENIKDVDIAKTNKRTISQSEKEVSDSASVSDTNSLCSTNEEFVDLTSVQQCVMNDESAASALEQLNVSHSN